VHSILKIKTGEDGIGSILLTVGNKRTDDCQIIRKPGRMLKPTATSSYYATWWMTRLGCRRRSCQAAICFGEAHGAFDPKIAEWDFPNSSSLIRKDGERSELKHLSRSRKRNQMR
jgi:hypothetical protein